MRPAERRAPDRDGLPRRVLVTTSHALPHIGGIEVLVEREVEALAARGVAVAHLSSSIGGEGGAPAEIAGLRRVRVAASDVLRRRFGLFLPLFAPTLLTAAWREVGRADVVHAHGFLSPSTWVALAFARLRGRRAILTEHNGLQVRRSGLATLLVRVLVATLGRLSVRLAHRGVTYNQRVAELLRRYGLADDRLRFAPYPLDTARFAPVDAAARAALRQRLGWPTDRPVVLCAGRLVTEKGLPLVLARHRPERFELVVCGAGDPRAVGLGEGAPGVRLLGARPPAAMPDLYRAADLLVLPSLVEGFPLVAREALACGTPVLLGDDPGYAPYRRLPGLSFCAIDADAVAAGIDAALARPRPDRSAVIAAQREWNDVDVWLDRIYG